MANSGRTDFMLQGSSKQSSKSTNRVATAAKSDKKVSKVSPEVKSVSRMISKTLGRKK